MDGLRKTVFLFFVSLVMLIENPKNVFCSPKVTAKYAVIYDIISKQVIYEKNAQTLVPPASTVKLLTAMVILDKWKMDRMILVPASVSTITPYKLHLKTGEKYSVKDLLYALLLRSANDVAHTLAVRAYGSEDQFAKAMNHKAKKFGVTKSVFKNPHGLPNIKQRVTACDMALIVAHIRNYPEIEKILKTKVSFFPGPGKRKNKLVNRNKLVLEKFKPLVLGKTGFTNKAGRCFAGYTKGNKTPFVVIALKTQYRWQDLRKLVKWGDGFYRRRIKQNKKILNEKEVLRFQKYLIDSGFLDGRADGVFGTQTQAAILKFQGNKNLKVDGIIGPKTISRISLS